MAYEEVTYTPSNIFADDVEDIVVMEGTAPASTAIPMYAPLKRDANAQLVPCTSIDDVSVGLYLPKLVNGVPTALASSAGAKKINWYKRGAFWASAVDFSLVTDAGAATNDQKQAMFDSTGIILRF